MLLFDFDIARLQIVDPILRAGELGLLGSLSQGRSDWVQVDVDRAGQQRCLVKNRNGREPSLPKSAGAAIFAVGLPGNFLSSKPHPPTDIGQSFAELFHFLAVACDRQDLVIVGLFCRARFVFADRTQR